MFDSADALDEGVDFAECICFAGALGQRCRGATESGILSLAMIL